MKTPFAVDVFMEPTTYVIEAESFREAMEEGKKRKIAEIEKDVHDNKLQVYSRARYASDFDRKIAK
jgi:hypothetical protein